MERLKKLVKAVIELDPVVEKMANSKVSNWLHVFAGFLLAYIDFHHAVLLAVLYFSYQVIEYVKRRDEVVNDLREFILGYVLGLLAQYFGVEVPLK